MSETHCIETKKSVKLNAAACRGLLPHRDVMAMIDGVSWYAPAERHLRAYKRVATSEFAVRGHFPRMPMFPPTLVIEALAQASGIMMNMERMRDHSGVELLRLDEPDYLARLPPIPLSVLAESNIKHHSCVLPGDTLELEAKIAAQRQEFRYFKVVARVAERLVAEGTILLSFPSYME
jgi:3-hydroxyacyl-[acyl-carrier-protein] dehydratase